MYDLYTWTTPNGRKISIMLEELGVPYTVTPIDIGKDEQFAPEFLKISPNNKIPAIVDHETGTHLMESGAILMYLAEKHGHFMPSGQAKWPVIEWLMWQMGGIGPFLGQAHHFLRFNKGKAPYAEERYSKEAKRLYGVLDKPRGSRLHVRRLLDRRHRDLALDLPLRMARDRHERVPECKALVPDGARPSGGAAGLSGSEGHGRSRGRNLLGSFRRRTMAVPVTN